MTIAGTAGQQRAAALLILAVVAVAVWAGPVSAYLDLLQSGAAALDQKAALLARYQGLWQSNAPPAAVVNSPSDLLLPEIPDSQALAMLQERVKGLAAASQVQIQGLQVLKAEPTAGAVRIGVRLRATGEVGALGRFLHAVETARPLLLPDNLQVQSRLVPASTTAAGATPTVPLDFQLDVAAFKTGASS